MKIGSSRRTYLFPFLLLLLVACSVSILLPRFRVEGQKESRVSWYGGEFHGRLAASGRNYNMLDFTAAHCTRPMESRLRITNLTNNRSVIIQVVNSSSIVLFLLLRNFNKFRNSHKNILK